MIHEKNFKVFFLIIFVFKLISQTSSGETDEKSLIIQGMCAFLLGLCLLFNSNQSQMYTM